LLGSSDRGCCPSCGAPWVRQLARRYFGGWSPGRDPLVDGAGKVPPGKGYRPPRTTGWAPSCACTDESGRALDPVPCTVLDPFGGTSTTGIVALRYGRSYLGIELNPEYAAISERRLKAELAQTALVDHAESEKPREIQRVLRTRGLFEDSAP